MYRQPPHEIRVPFSGTRPNWSQICRNRHLATIRFRNGPQRIRIESKYENYKRFGAQSTIMLRTERVPDRISGQAEVNGRRRTLPAISFRQMQRLVAKKGNFRYNVVKT